MIDLFFCPLLNHVVEKLAIFWVLVFWFSYNERCLFQRNLPWDFKESVKKFKTQSKLLNHTNLKLVKQYITLKLWTSVRWTESWIIIRLYLKSIRKFWEWRDPKGDRKWSKKSDEIRTLKEKLTFNSLIKFETLLTVNHAIHVMLLQRV